MTDEQNKPVRSRDEQAKDVARQLAWPRTLDDGDILTAEDILEEAEERGAAEQWRKDAGECERWEFEEPEYRPHSMGCGLEDSGIHDRYEAMEYGWDQAVERCIECIPEDLFFLPANVAALEGRIAELEKALKEIIDTAGSDCIHGLGPYIKIAQAALKRTGTPS